MLFLGLHKRGQAKGHSQMKNWRNWHLSAQQNILGLPTIVLHWHCLFLVLLLFCCNYFCFSILFFNKLKLKSSKVHFILSTLHPFKPQWKMAAFPRPIVMTGQAMSSRPIIKSHTYNAWLKCWQKKRGRNDVKKCGPFSFFADGQAC